MKTNKLILGLITLLLTLPVVSWAKESKVQFEDVVMRMVDIEDGQKIMFKKHAGIYYLKKNVKDYEVMKATLESGRKSSSKVKVEANASTLEINKLIK
jgi:hypothetical protein